MLTRLRLHNFKAFENLSLDLRSITLILGPNNSGKSSIISPLRLLIQTMESYDLEVPLLLDGIMGDFGTYKDIVYGNHRARPFSISLDFGLENIRIPRMDSDRYPSLSDIQLDLIFKYRTKRRELILKELRLTQDNQSLVRLDYSPDSERLLLTSLGTKIIPPAAKSSISRSLQLNHFLPFISFIALTDRRRNAEAAISEEDVSQIRRILPSVTNRIRHAFRNMEYIGAMRVPPSRTYLFTGEKRRRIGATGENAASLIVMDAARSGRQKKRLKELTGDWLKRAGIAGSLDVVPLSERHYELRISHPVTKEKQNISDVGYGNSQVIPVLVGGYNLEPGAIYLVEEPEIHLHPKAQAELGTFFFELYKRNVQSIVETHSEYLILRLQQFVADKKISPNDIVFYYVNPSEDGSKAVSKLELDETGKFINDWPHGFFPERLEEAKRLSQIRFKHLTENPAGSNAS